MTETKLGLQGDVRLLSQVAAKFETHLLSIWEQQNEHLKDEELEVLEVELDRAVQTIERSVELVKKFRRISEARK